MKNSIYGALRNINNKIGLHSDKLAVAYIYSLLKSSRRTVSSLDPLIEEAQNLYVALDTIGVNTLENGDFVYKKAIINYLREERNPIIGTIEEVLLKVLKKNGFKESMKIVGNTLTDILSSNPNFDCDSESLRAGNIQKYEQRALKSEFSKFC